MRSTLGANVIKLFLSVIYEFSYQARVSVCYTSVEKLTKGKHSSSLRKFVNYVRKKFYNIGPWMCSSFFWPGLNKMTRQISKGGGQSCFNKVGHLRVCKQSKRGWEPIVMSQLYESEICILVMSQLHHQKHKL
jgi:hypothetical protein